jgi:hypothetical protein
LTNQGTKIHPLFLLFLFIQALVFRIILATLGNPGLRTSQKADLLQGCANPRACDREILSYRPNASDVPLLSAIQVASHLHIKNKVTTQIKEINFGYDYVGG